MTIKDIARESGYSVGTVSRTLNKSQGVSEKARKRIMEVVEKYHFELNSNARHLKKQSKDGIAIIIKGTNNMLFAAIVEHLQRMIRDRKYACMVYYIGEDDNEVEQAIRICQDRNPYGILFLGCNKDHFRAKFSVIPIPCVLVTSTAEDLGFDNLSSVGTDDVEGARYAVNHFSWADGYSSAKRLIQKMPDVTAIFAMADITAIGAIRALTDAGYRIPRDISIIGYDGLEIGGYLVPKLTTIHQNVMGISTKCMEILMDHIDKGIRSVHVLEPFYLLPGETVMRKQ